MDKKIILALLATGLLLFALVSFVSAPSKNIEIKDKREEHISVVPGAVFCVERNLSSKGKAMATIAPLFSDGLILESIGLKKTTTETYTVDVPDYGTCTREIETAMNSTVECPSTCSLNLNDTCVCMTEEKYSCVTGYHQEEKTREIVIYMPLKDGSYESDKPEKNNKENEIERHREKLPERLKGLKNIGHSKDFNIGNDATIRMCFRAPEWDSDITSGTISYLTYDDLDYDYESSTAWDFYSYRMRINCSNMADGIPLVINGSNGFSSLNGQECGKQIVWTYCSGINTSLYYNNCSNYSVWNNSEQLPMDVSIGNVGSYNAKDVYTNGILVAHLDDNTGTSLRDSTRHSNASILGAENEWISGKVGYAVNFTSSANGNLINNTHLGQVSLASNSTNTILMWVRPFDISIYKMLFSYGGDSFLDIEPASPRLKYFSAAGAGTGFATEDAVSIGNWIFIGAVRDNASNARIHLNGNLNASTTSFTASTITTTFTFMGYHNGLYHPAGTIDEIMVFNTNLSSAQINATYQNQIGTSGYGNLGPEETSGGGQQGGNGTEAVIESSSGSIILSPAGGGRVKFTASLTDGSNEVSVANMKAAYEHYLQDVIKSILNWQDQCNSCVGANDINANEVQKRVQNSCSASQAISSIDVNGTTSCVNLGNGSGGIIDTNAATICSGTNTYLDGEGNCDDISTTYVKKSGDTMSGPLTISGGSKNVVLTSGAYGLISSDGQIMLDGTGNIVSMDTMDMNGNNIRQVSKIGNYIDAAENPYLDFGWAIGAITFRGSVANGFIPDSNNTYSIGANSLRWKEGYFNTVWNNVNRIGDVREYYKENPNYNYEIGTVVAIDTNSGYEIKPLTDVTDRILGVVANMSHNATEKVCDGSGCYNLTYHLDTDVAIYGKFSPVKVRGTIQVGDYLVASDEEGVVTSMYDKEHPFNPSMFKKSKNKREYNFNAKMFPTLGIAMENYNSTQVGTIKVVLGK